MILSLQMMMKWSFDNEITIEINKDCIYLTATIEEYDTEEDCQVI